MASQWDHRADKALLLAIIEDGQCKSINWRIIATKMKAKNYTFTHEACRQHFQKIRRENKTASSSNSASSLATPTKEKTTNGTGSNNSKRKSASKSASFASTIPYDEDDEEDIGDTPSKRQKSVKKEEYDNRQQMPIFKIEKDAKFVDLSNDSLYNDSDADV